MATVGTLFVNIAAKTQPFVAAMRGSMAQARASVTSANRALVAYGQTSRSMFTGQQTYTTFSRLAAAAHTLSPALGRGMFSMQRLGTSALNVGANIRSSFMQLGAFFRFGWIGSILAVGGVVGYFMTRVTKLSIGRFQEIRSSLFAITRAWRQVELSSSRAFAPAVKAVTDLIGARISDYFGETSSAMMGVAAVGLILVGIFGTLVEVVRMVWNIVTALGRVLLGVVSYVVSIVEYATDAIGLTDAGSNMSLATGNALMADAFGDVKDFGNAGYNIGDTWARVGEGIGNVVAGPGASGLTESGYGGSAALIDEARRQNVQLQRIENAIVRSGGLR
jgi:hypothetical protein